MTGGTLIRIIPRTLFDFGYLPDGATGEIVVAKAVNVIPYSYAALWIRVYQLRLGTTSTASVVTTAALPADDTQLSFLLTTTTQGLTGTPPVLITKDVTTPIPPYLQIKVTATQPATATYIGVDISIDLLVRCCG